MNDSNSDRNLERKALVAGYKDLEAVTALRSRIRDLAAQLEMDSASTERLIESCAAAQPLRLPSIYEEDHGYEDESSSSWDLPNLQDALFSPGDPFSRISSPTESSGRGKSASISPSWSSPGATTPEAQSPVASEFVQAALEQMTGESSMHKQGYPRSI